jgi:hypothetical protein
MRGEPKISILEDYNFRLTLVAGQYCPSLTLNTKPSIIPTAESIYGTPFSWFCPATSPIQLPSLRYPQLSISLSGLLCLGTEDLGKEVSNL